MMGVACYVGELIIDQLNGGRVAVDDRWPADGWKGRGARPVGVGGGGKRRRRIA